MSRARHAQQHLILERRAMRHTRQAALAVGRNIWREYSVPRKNTVYACIPLASEPKRTSVPPPIGREQTKDGDRISRYLGSWRGMGKRRRGKLRTVLGLRLRAHQGDSSRVSSSLGTLAVRYRFASSSSHHLADSLQKPCSCRRPRYSSRMVPMN